MYSTEWYVSLSFNFPELFLIYNRLSLINSIIFITHDVEIIRIYHSLKKKINST